MGRLLYLSALATVASLFLAPAALAQVQNPEDCPAGTQAFGDSNGFTGCVPVEELCDVDALTPSQYSECIATPEEITDGGGKGASEREVKGRLMIISDDTGTLPDTGGPALLLPAAGLLLATGLVGIKLVRRRL